MSELQEYFNQNLFYPLEPNPEKEEKESKCLTHNELTQDLWGNGVWLCESCLIESSGCRND